MKSFHAGQQLTASDIHTMFDDIIKDINMLRQDSFVEVSIGCFKQEGTNKNDTDIAADEFNVAGEQYFDNRFGVLLYAPYDMDNREVDKQVMQRGDQYGFLTEILHKIDNVGGM